MEWSVGSNQKIQASFSQNFQPKKKKKQTNKQQQRRQQQQIIGIFFAHTFNFYCDITTLRFFYITIKRLNF